MLHHFITFQVRACCYNHNRCFLKGTAIVANGIIIHLVSLNESLLQSIWAFEKVYDCCWFSFQNSFWPTFGGLFHLNTTTMIRNATAVWNGSGKEGTGKLTTQSGILKDASYGYRSRFENGPGTNPEELVAAAHAGCFTMKLSFSLGEKGLTPDSLQTRCEITFENGVITKSHLTVEAKVPGASEQQFQAAVKDAEQNCPISKLLKTEIVAEGKLIQ
jgi:lipoyl-dependent peroxiredoxin